MERFGMLFISPWVLNLLVSLRMFKMKLHHFKRPKYRLRLTQRNDNKKALFSVFRLKFCHSQVCSIRRGSFPGNWAYSVLRKPRFFVLSGIFYVPNKAQVTPSLVSFKVLIKNFANYENPQPFNMEAPHGGESYNINTTFLYYLPPENNLIWATLCLIVTFKLNIPKGKGVGGGGRVIVLTLIDTWIRLNNSRTF